jgi:multidrug resistance efflux pump
VGALLLLMNYNHAYGKYGREVFVSIPIVPNVAGEVVAVEVKANSFVKKGEVLFRLDPVPFELELKRARAKLMEIGQDTRGQQERWKASRAKVKLARAKRDRAKNVYERFAADPDAFSKVDVENRKQSALSAQAALEVAEAEEMSARQELMGKVEGEDPEVALVKAEFMLQEYRLKQSVVRAPVDGLVTQVLLRPGFRAVTLPFKPTMIFIPSDRRRFAASFWQNSLLRIKPGYEAEVVLDAVPGHVFKGSVSEVLSAMSEGEVQASGKLLSADLFNERGKAVAIIDLEENLDDYHLPMGVQGQAAVYSEHMHHVGMVRRVLLRMMSWLKYVFPIK